MLKKKLKATRVFLWGIISYVVIVVLLVIFGG